MTSTNNQTGPLALSATAGSLLLWAEEHLCSLTLEKPYMAMDDDDGIWKVVEWGGRESFGSTIQAAIQDAQRSDDDPNRWTYIPPEFRENAKHPMRADRK